MPGIVKEYVIHIQDVAEKISEENRAVFAIVFRPKEVFLKEEGLFIPELVAIGGVVEAVLAERQQSLCGLDFVYTFKLLFQLVNN